MQEYWNFPLKQRYPVGGKGSTQEGVPGGFRAWVNMVLRLGPSGREQPSSGCRVGFPRAKEEFQMGSAVTCSQVHLVTTQSRVEKAVAPQSGGLSDTTERLHFTCHALAWRIPGMVEPGGLLSMGSHRVGHD